MDTWQLTTLERQLFRSHEELVRRRLTVIQVIDYALSNVLHEDEDTEEDTNHELVVDSLYGTSVDREASNNSAALQETSEESNSAL